MSGSTVSAAAVKDCHERSSSLSNVISNFSDTRHDRQLVGRDSCEHSVGLGSDVPISDQRDPEDGIDVCLAWPPVKLSSFNRSSHSFRRKCSQMSDSGSRYHKLVPCYLLCNRVNTSLATAIVPRSGSPSKTCCGGISRSAQSLPNFLKLLFRIQLQN